MNAPCKFRWSALGLFVRDDQTARLLDILIFGPFLLATGIMVKQLPKSLRVALIASGSFVIVWNGVNYLIRSQPESVQALESVKLVS